MNITIAFPSIIDKRRSATLKGKIIKCSINDLKRIWEAERAINELTNLRVHISIHEEEVGENKDNADV